MNSSLRETLFGCLLILLPMLPLLAQGGLGWALDPHAGLHAAFLQPAATAEIPYPWDANLGTFGVNVNNDYAYLESTSALGLWRQLRSANSATFDPDNFSFRLGNTTYRYGFPESQRPLFVHAAVDVLGPSLSFQIGEFTRLGGFLRTRGIASTNGLAANLGYSSNAAIPFNTAFPIEEIFLATAWWSEVGLHYSRAFFVGNDAELHFGINARYLIAHEGGSLTTFGSSQATKLGQDQIELDRGRAEINFSQGFRTGKPSPSWAGDGFAADFGLQYAWGSRSGGGYYYRLGFSLLDLGVLNFGSVNQTHRFRDFTGAILNANNFAFEDAASYVDEAVRQLSRDGNGGNPNGSQTGSEFPLRLPTAISLQFSVRPFAGIQFAAAYRGDLPFAKEQLTSGQILMGTAHYSKHWYGGGLALGLRQWRYLNLGLQLRAGPFFFGTDQLLGTLLPAAQLQGAQFYFGLRLHNLRKAPKVKYKGQSWRPTKAKGKRVRCYDFK